MNGLQGIFDELNRQSNSGEMPRRIELCREALKMISKAREPELWAELQNDLACSLLKNPLGPHGQNIEEALQHFGEALKVRTRKKHPTQWAIIQDNLGTAYRDRTQNDRAENIEKAIYHYEQALVVRTCQSDPKRWAMTQHNLADAYCVRIRGKRVENLEQAIRYANQALEVFIYADEAFRYSWAQVQNTLGEIYRVRIRESRKENIERSIQHFNQALTVFVRDTFTEDWAKLQQNLGIVYTDRIADAQAENIERAIYHSEQALEIYDCKTFPQAWALAQHNLGNAYRLRIHGDRAENLEQSILHFQYALSVLTRQAFPENRARTQNELGNAYLARIRNEREKNVEQAINQYLQALEVFTRQAFPEEWARVCNNLGNAYLARIDPERTGITEKLDNANLAILNYEQALTIRTRDAFPEDWAETQSNLAGAERIRASVEDLERAIHHLEPVLEIYTRDAFPQHWARTHNNLAIIYTDRKQGDPADNLKQAISHYQQALEVYTLQGFPKDCLKTARGLGKLTFDKQQWELARNAYDTVLMAQDELMHASFSPASEKAELLEVQNLPPRAAYVYMKMGDSRRAVEVLEKGRAQLLRGSFELQQQNLKRLIALKFETLFNDYIQARNEHQSLQNGKIFNDEPSAAWKQAVEKMRAATSAIREQVGQRHPEYRYFLQSLSCDEIQEQARGKPLIYLCATSAGGFALVVTGEGIKVMEIPELDQEGLQNQIWRPSNEEIDRINAHLQRGVIEMEDIQAVKGGFFSMYALWNLTSHLTRTSDELKLQLFLAWQDTLDETTHWLWDTVMGRLMPLLKEQGKSVVLIPVGQLALLPLHAAWTDDPSKPTRRRYVLDEVNISYAPSAHSLHRANLATERPAENLLLVNDPDGSLSHIEIEIQAVLAMFQKSKHIQGRAATIATVKEGIQKADVLYFFTHANAGWQAAEQARLKLADGYLTLPDIHELDLNQARLAVLSACETGVPGLELIDEMIGLPAGMLQAGVPGIVGSLWSVKAISTAMLMVHFFFLWRKAKHPPQEALLMAQVWLRDSTVDQKKEFFKSFVVGKLFGMSVDTAIAFYKYLSFAEPGKIDYSSPYYWAAFTYTGV